LRCRSEYPLIIVDKSPTGIWNGKSKAASMIAKKIHQPAMLVTNTHAPAATCVRCANASRLADFAGFDVAISIARALCQYVAARSEKASTRVKKMITKTTLVRSEQIR